MEGKKYEFISFKHGFHGRTAAALTLTHKPAIRQAFMPLVPGVHYAEFNDIESVKRYINDKTAGIFVEPIQGEGGVYPADPAFMRDLRALCDKHDALLITDEVQCGLGRTGKLFAHELYDVTPDVMTLAKPLAGGLPIGAILLSNKVASAIAPGQHGTTFGGNPLVCAVAKTVLTKIMDDDFLAKVRARGEYLATGLKKLQLKYPKQIADVRGNKGLFCALECHQPVGPLIKFALAKRVLIISAGNNTIRLCPPLVVDEKDIDQLLHVFDQAFREEIL